MAQGSVLLPDPVTNRWCDHHLAENACTPSSARYSTRSRHLAALRVTVAVWEGGVLCRPSRVRQPWRERSPSCKKHPGSYSDYTGYMPVNTVEAVIDPNRWQPLMTAAGAQQYSPALRPRPTIRPHIARSGAARPAAALPAWRLRQGAKPNPGFGLTQGLAAGLTGPEPEAGHLSASAQVATRRAVSAPRSDNGVARSHATIWTARCRHKTRQRSVTLAG